MIAAKEEIDDLTASLITPHQIINFFNYPKHRNIEIISYFMKKIEWSKISTEETLLTNEMIGRIFSYTTHYEVNSFLRESFWEKNSITSKLSYEFSNEYVKKTWGNLWKIPWL